MASAEMLRSRLDFAALQAGGRSRVAQLVVLRYRRNGLERTRYGISTSRRIGGAVVRNRIRRRLRPLLNGIDERVEPGWDLLIICRQGAASATQAELHEQLERVVRQAGLLKGEVTGAMSR